MNTHYARSLSSSQKTATVPANNPGTNEGNNAVLTEFVHYVYLQVQGAQVIVAVVVVVVVAPDDDRNNLRGAVAGRRPGGAAAARARGRVDSPHGGECVRVGFAECTFTVHVTARKERRHGYCRRDGGC